MCFKVAKMTYQWLQSADFSDDSVSEGLHHAIRNLGDKCMDEDAEVRAASVNAEAIVERKESQDRDARDVAECEDVPTYWAPFVKFGV